MTNQKHIASFVCKTALFIAVFTMLCANITSERTNKIAEIKIEKSDKATEDSGKAVVIYKYEAIVPFIQINIFQDFYFIIQTISFELKELIFFNDGFSPSTCNYFKTLFRQIISANAP